jgi:hypothetical protein
VSLEKRKQIDPLDQAIEAALSPGNFIPYNAAWSFVDDLQDVANDIGKIIKKEPERAANLYGTFIAACHEKADEIDDSSGNFGMLVRDLFRGWIKARQAANQDPDETARYLLSWMEDDPYGFCHDLNREAVRVLDKKGLEAFVHRIRSWPGSRKWLRAPPRTSLRRFLSAQNRVGQENQIADEGPDNWNTYPWRKRRVPQKT